jgi:hypothetical protein
MARDVMVETRGDRTALAADAGYGRISLGSVLAGTLVAYGAFAVLLAVAAAVIKAVGINTDVSTNQWHQMGAGAAAAVAVVLFVAYLYGGYVTGRMARRSGMMNGLLVFFLSIVIAVGVAAFARWLNADDVVLRNLRNIGVPTSRSEWSYIGTIAGIASLAAMLLGCVVGGTLGERWHGKLLTRAWDPAVGDGVPVAAGTRHVVDDGQTVMTRGGDTDTERTDRTDSTLDEDYAGRDGDGGERRDTTMFAGPTID